MPAVLPKPFRSHVCRVLWRSYERKVIEQWLAKNDTSPLTGLKLAHVSSRPQCQLVVMSPP